MRYFTINFSIIFGHPLRNPLQTVLRRVEILGLHGDWCVDLTALAKVCTEWVNAAKDMPRQASLATNPGCGAQPKQVPGCGRTVGPGGVHTFVWIGKVHRSILGSLYPVDIV